MRIDNTNGVVSVVDVEHRWEPCTGEIYTSARLHSYRNDPICTSPSCRGVLTRWNAPLPPGTNIRFVGCSNCGRRVIKFTLSTTLHHFHTVQA